MADAGSIFQSGRRHVLSLFHPFGLQAIGLRLPFVAAACRLRKGQLPVAAAVVLDECEDASNPSALSV